MPATIDTHSTVAEVLLANPSRAAIFEKHHIDYCCNGKRTLEEACERRGLDVASVVAELEGPGSDQTESCALAVAGSCASLVQHIVNVHHAFLRQELPRIAVLAEKVSKVHGDHEPKCRTIAEVFAAMKSELEEHMQKEERVLFPFVVRLEQGTDTPFGTIGSPIACMEDEHREVGEALERLRDLTDNFTPPIEACNTWRVLYHSLEALSRDLHQHIHEENNALFPLALGLESNLRKAAI